MKPSKRAVGLLTASAGLLGEGRPVTSPPRFAFLWYDPAADSDSARATGTGDGHESGATVSPARAKGRSADES